MKLMSELKSGNIVRRKYRCPCGKGFIEEEQDYTPGHRDGFAWLDCTRCSRYYKIDFGMSEIHWELKRIIPQNTQKQATPFQRRRNMNLDNVFYFKNIVDRIYPDEDRAAADIQTVVLQVENSLKTLSDDQFIEVMISCFIPDLYSGMGKREKLFTKLTELMVGEWWRRMGGEYNLPTKKSGTEDVELKYSNISIVCDAKVFRLGRSQKAPNVKDFLKLASVALWINNLKQKYAEQGVDRNVIGGLVTYSSLHEWESDSEVYEECTNHDTPVVMLPYEVLALLLKYKNRVVLTEFLKLWEYGTNNVTTSRNKKSYWQYISGFVCRLLSLSADAYNQEMKEYHRVILQSASEYRKIVQQTIDETKRRIILDLERFDNIDELRQYVSEAIVSRDNSLAVDYLKHIDDFRYYRDQD